MQLAYIEIVKKEIFHILKISSMKKEISLKGDYQEVKRLIF